MDPLYTHGWMDIQTDGDYTKHVVTPFGTTRLKRQRQRRKRGRKKETTEQCQKDKKS